MISRDIEAQIEHEAARSPCQKTCSNWFDPNFFKSVIDVKDIFCPMTWKKPLWWGGTVIALGGVITIEVTTGAFSTAATYNNVGIMTALYAVDPIIQTINIIAAKYPPALAESLKPLSGDNIPDESEEMEAVPAHEQDSVLGSPYGSEIASEYTNHSPYSSSSEISKGKEELDSPYQSDNETVYDYMVDDVDLQMHVITVNPEIVDNYRKNKDVGVVIPTHLAADKIGETIRSLLVHIRPNQIFIIDNGHSNAPMDNTREVIANISPDIHYVWGHKGNKTYAQLIGTFLANDFKYIYTSDDDMRVPRFFSFGTERINDNVKAVCYPILGVHPEPGQTNWWIRAQSLEYTLADCSKLAQDRFGDVLYPHGAASLWEKETFLEVLHKHTAIFYAEDMQFGMLLQRSGYAMSIDASACLDTEVPTSLFGPNPNFVQQRGRSWEMGRQFNYFKYVYQLFCVAPPTKSPINFAMHKLAEAYAVYTNTVDWMRFPLFLLLLRNPDYWIRLAALTAAGYIPLLGWNYIKLPINQRKDLQAGIADILTFPIFKIVESAMSIYGIGRLLSVYGPNYTHKPTVQEFEDSFRENPNALEREIYDEALNPAIPPVTYKTVMYGRLFKPAQSVEEIERAFDANIYDMHQGELQESLQHVIHTHSPAVTEDEIGREFEENKYYLSCNTALAAIEGPRTNTQAPTQQPDTELGALHTLHNPAYQPNTLQQDNPIFDRDSSNQPARHRMSI